MTQISNFGRTVLYVAARYLTALLLMVYGFAKLNGSQFTILNSELDKPMGAVSGFWLTWYYFGYSPVYGTFIALAQVVAASLLLFRRTTLLGACMAFPIVANIILIDIFYRIDLGALLVALIIELAVVIVLAFHGQELLDLFWTKQNVLFPSRPVARVGVFAKHAARVLLVLIPAVFTYWVANYNNRLPTPIDGAWDVVQSPLTGPTTKIPVTIFFERNRAYLCVFKQKDGAYEWHHFEVNPNEHSITIWDLWLTKGKKIFAGRYDLSGNQLQIDGSFADNPNPMELQLRKRE